jgi:hypothetical protein
MVLGVIVMNNSGELGTGGEGGPSWRSGLLSDGPQKLLKLARSFNLLWVVYFKLLTIS